MVLGVKLFKEEEKDPVPIPFEVLVVSAIVGLVVVDQTMPLAVMEDPPSAVMLPPDVAEVVVIEAIPVVVSVGTAFNLFAKQNLKQVSRFLNL